MSGPPPAVKFLPSAPWMAEGACRDYNPNLWFPVRGASTLTARSVCAVCPVRTECRDYALEHCIRNGIWGGLSERQRRQVRAGRRPL